LLVAQRREADHVPLPMTKNLPDPLGDE